MKTSLSRLASILFPELELLIPTLHMVSVCQQLSEFLGALQISAHLSKFSNLCSEASSDRYGMDNAIRVRDAAKFSINSVVPLPPKKTYHPPY